MIQLALCAPALAGTLRGDLAKWQPLSIDFEGPWASERDDAPNPFLDYRLSVRFTSPSGRTVDVPGFFAGDGSGGDNGRTWRVRFAADERGQWQYSATMRQGHRVAVELDAGAGNHVELAGSNGQFWIDETRWDAPGFLKYGRLEYVGEHYLKFRDGPWWIKGGTNSPENLLGYTGIDGTEDHGGVDGWFLHDFAAHRGDWRDGDPLFSHAGSGADSRGLIGALNYLGAQGVNSVYFLPMNLGGDGQDTYPFVSADNDPYSKTHYDLGKLYQWNQVLAHAQRQGIALNIVLSETEEGNERWLDGGAMGVERKLFFRELVARFGYLLAVKWNLGEESDWPLTALHAQSDYLRALDWSDKPVAVHNHLNDYYRYGEMLGDKRFSASSIQYNAWDAGDIVERWRASTANAGHRWVLDMDENTNGLAAADVDARRREILYDVYFSGGNIEWYYGANPMPAGGDITAGDFRLREIVWRQMRYAREMMQNNLPFWRMQPADALVEGDSDAYGGAEVFAARGESYAIYLPSSNGNEKLNVETDGGNFHQRWFDPRTGQFVADANARRAGNWVLLGAPPSRPGDDWVVLVQRGDAAVNTGTPVSPPPASANRDPRFVDVTDVSAAPGTLLSLSVHAVDDDGPYPSVTVAAIPGGMQVYGAGQGQLDLNWQVPVDASGSATVELVAIDAEDSSRRTTQSFTVHIDGGNGQGGSTGGSTGGSGGGATSPGNTSPAGSGSSGLSFHPVGAQSLSAGDTLVLRIQPFADNGTVPALVLSNLPAGAEFRDNGDGTRSLVWPTSASDVGDHVLQFMARDALQPSRTATLEVAVRVTQ